LLLVSALVLPAGSGVLLQPPQLEGALALLALLAGALFIA
jgi:hypothetical protein